MKTVGISLSISIKPSDSSYKRLMIRTENARREIRMLAASYLQKSRNPRIVAVNFRPGILSLVDHAARDRRATLVQVKSGQTRPVSTAHHRFALKSGWSILPRSPPPGMRSPGRCTLANNPFALGGLADVRFAFARPCWMCRALRNFDALPYINVDGTSRFLGFSPSR